MKIIIGLLILMLTSCKMYDWRYQYSGQEKREITPALMEVLKDPDKKVNRDEKQIPKGNRQTE